MAELYERGERIDRVTVANELMKHRQLESCDGLSYLVSLDDGLPHISNLDSYVRIVRDKSILRRIIFTSQKLIDRCLSAKTIPMRFSRAPKRACSSSATARARTRWQSRCIIREYRGRHQRLPRSQQAH